PKVKSQHSQVETLLRYRYDTYVSEFLDAKNKDGVAKGWKRVQLMLNLDANVEYSVEQCKNKVSALKSLWLKIKSDEGATGNAEKQTKQPEYFEAMVLHFGNKSGLSGDTLGNAASESAVNSNEAAEMLKIVQADDISACSSTSSIATLGSKALLTGSGDTNGNGYNSDRIDSDGPDDVDHYTAATSSSSKDAGKQPKRRRKWQKMNKEENLATLQGEQGIGKDMANGLTEMGKSIATAISGSEHENDQLCSLTISQENCSKQLSAIADGRHEIVEASNRMSSLLESSQVENSKQLAEMVKSNNRVSNLLEQFLMRSMGNN
ncbi:hypothetical protein HDU78_000532, partial [Chytriomyces hyalinus]